MYLTDCFCLQCNKIFQGTNRDVYCNECSSILQKNKIESALKLWRGSLTLEERVAKIEEWLINYNDHEHVDPLSVKY